MTSINRRDAQPLPRKALCLALAAAFATTAWAEEDDEVTRLIKPESNVSIGVGHVSGDNQRFGVYNGLEKEGTYGIGKFSIIKRDDDTGTWFRAEGRNIGLPTAEARIEHERQGHWRYYLEVDQLKRYTPYEVHSGLQGVGTNYLSYPNTTGAQARSSGTLPDFSTERLGSKLGFSHNFNPELDFSVVFQNVEKKGERLFGRGTNAGSAQEFLAEPINSITRQLDVILNYTGDKLQLSGGYYGSWYLNADNQLNVAGGDSNLRNSSAATPIPMSVIALPPDNYSHQLHLSGGYQFTDKTRGNFKVAYTHAGQTDSFPGVPATNNGIATPTGGLNMSGRSDLGGHLDTTLVQLGVTSRPITNLSLLGNVRYENRDDNTSIARYININSGTTNSTDGFNEPRSLKVMSGKFEASYLLPLGYRLTAGIEQEQKERTVEGVRVVGYRERTDETSYRLELQHSLAESLNGSVAYVHSERTGSDYRTLRFWNGVTQSFNTTTLYSNRVQPIYIADRDRDKVRLFADWTPIDALNVQLAVEDSSDRYGAGRDSLDIGPRSGGAQLYSLDATWTLNDRWRANGWTSYSASRMSQASGNGGGLPYYTAGLYNYVSAFGLGLHGKITGRLDVGADAVLSTDLSQYKLGGNATSNLPDIKYDQTTLKFFGRYAMSKDTSVRIDYVFDHRKTNDWTWNGTTTSGPYVYTDGTYLYQRPEDKVHFIGISVAYSFR